MDLDVVIICYHVFNVAGLFFGDWSRFHVRLDTSRSEILDKLRQPKMKSVKCRICKLEVEMESLFWKGKKLLHFGGELIIVGVKGKLLLLCESGHVDGISGVGESQRLDLVFVLILVRHGELQVGTDKVFGHL